MDIHSIIYLPFTTIHILQYSISFYYTQWRTNTLLMDRQYNVVYGTQNIYQILNPPFTIWHTNSLPMSTLSTYSMDTKVMKTQYTVYGTQILYRLFHPHYSRAQQHFTNR